MTINGMHAPVGALIRRRTSPPNSAAHADRDRRNFLAGRCAYPRRPTRKLASLRGPANR